MPEASDGKKFPYTKKGMADYKKYQGSLDRYNKTMGFTHNNTNSIGEYYKRQGKFIGAKVLDSIQKAGWGHKEPHVHRPDIAEDYYKRPTPSYKKDKFEGKVAGAEKAMLSEYGNKSKWSVGMAGGRTEARKKLVKGT